MSEKKSERVTTPGQSLKTPSVFDKVIPSAKKVKQVVMQPAHAVMNVVKPTTQAVLNAVNPVYIAGKLNPHAQQVIRLLKPVVEPKRQVNWIRSQLSWKNLQAPLSAVAAVVLGGLCAVFSQASTGVSLSPASVISITTIVMEFGSTERFYIRSALRILGTVMGALVGFGFGIIGIYIGDESSGKNIVALQAYRLSIVAFGALITFVGMKLFEQTSYAFMMFGVTMFTVVYTYTWVSAFTAMLSALAGVTVSIFTILIFQFPKADAILAKTHKIVVENLFTLVRFAVESDPRCMDDFDDCAGSVRSALVTTAGSFEVYAQWRRWTKRQVLHDFDSLSTATRPLFYVSYSMYWSLVQAPSANPNGGQFFFCNTPAQYDMYFRSTRMMLEGSIMAIQGCLSRILVRDPKDTCAPHELIEMIVSRHLWSGCVRNIQILKEQYISNREECFSSFGQHWSVCDYLHQLISLTLAITAYVHAIADTFLPHFAEHIYPTFEDICENLSQLRNEGSSRVEHFNQYVNPHRLSKTQSSFGGGPHLDPNFNQNLNQFTSRSGHSRISRGINMDANPRSISDPPSPSEGAAGAPYMTPYGMMGRGVGVDEDAEPFTPGSRHRALSP